VDPAERARVESAVSDVRSALKSDDKNAIEKKTEALAQASAAIAQRAYASEGNAPGGQPNAGAGAAGAAGGRPQGGSPGRDDVVDAEFEEVKDKDRKAS
jgi:molecular chaperone DnaK